MLKSVMFAPERFNKSRWMQCEASGGYLALYEIWTDGDLQNNAICFQLGGYFELLIAIVMWYMLICPFMY